MPAYVLGCECAHVNIHECVYVHAYVSTCVHLYMCVFMCVVHSLITLLPGTDAFSTKFSLSSFTCLNESFSTGVVEGTCTKHFPIGQPIPVTYQLFVLSANLEESKH